MTDGQSEVICHALQQIVDCMERKEARLIKQQKQADDLLSFIKPHLENLFPDLKQPEEINEVDCGRCCHSEQKLMGCYCVLHHLALSESVDDCEDFLIKSEELRND